MKCLLLIFLFSNSPHIDWVDDLDRKINVINTNSILKKEKHSNSKYEITVTKKYKYKRYKKIEVTLSGSFFSSFNFQTFSKNGFVFATHSFIQAPYLQKGGNYPGRPEGEITEVKEYFLSKNEGLKLRRTIDYFENSNIDSLKLELLKKEFDTVPNSIYKSVKKKRLILFY